MTVDEAILTALEPLEGLKTKPGPVEILKNAVPPFVFWLQIRSDEEDALDGPTGLLEAAFEINCVAATYPELLKLAKDVKTALKSMQGKEYDGLLIERAHITQTSPDLREREVNLYRRMYVLQINYQDE